VGVAQDQALFAYFRQRIVARRQHPPLVYRWLITRFLDNESGIWAVERVNDSDRVVSVFSVSEPLQTLTWPIEKKFHARQGKFLWYNGNTRFEFDYVG
jgi:glycosidase